jgi:hypothetical protein
MVLVNSFFGIYPFLGKLFIIRTRLHLFRLRMYKRLFLILNSIFFVFVGGF